MAFWDALDTASPGMVGQVCAEHLHSEFIWNGPAPVNRLEGAAILAAEFWVPMRQAIPDLRREIHMVFGGASSGRADGGPDGQMWVCGTGYLSGQPTGSFLGVPALGRPVRIRWGEFLRFDGEQIVEAQTIIDFVDWFDQIGLPVLPPPLGAAHVYPAPTAYDGILADAQDATESNETLEFGRNFIFGGLNKFDQQDLSKMGMARFFHPNLKWYGPACRLLNSKPCTRNRGLKPIPTARFRIWTHYLRRVACWGHPGLLVCVQLIPGLILTRPQHKKRSNSVALISGCAMATG